LATPVPIPHLSVVIPAFNEEDRLEATLVRVSAFLAAKPYTSEVVLVLDGCTDGSAAIAKRYVGTTGSMTLRVLENERNRGKGACVRQGMLAATGAFRLFMDADLSYPLEQIDVFLSVLEEKGGCAIAWRKADPTKHTRLSRKVTTVLSRQVTTRFVPGVSDTQAGFKAFEGRIVDDIFALQRVTGFGFDVEVLHIAAMRGYVITPVPVPWDDVAGSKVRLTRDIPKMLADLASIVVNRARGRYQKRT
jgi:dolichyl-phosphate beta-glucosyltransferase